MIEQRVYVDKYLVWNILFVCEPILKISPFRIPPALPNLYFFSASPDFVFNTFSVSIPT